MNSAISNPLTRRGFMALSAAAGGVVLASCARTLGTTPVAAATTGRKLDRIGLQLYTLRNAFRKDPYGTIKAIAKVGFNSVEYAHADDYPITFAELRKACDGEGLAMETGIFGVPDFYDKLPRTIDIAGQLGLRYTLNGWINEQDRSVSGYKAQSEAFNRFGADLRKAGLRYAYHNHDFEFVRMPDGQRPIDILMQNTDPALVEFELDMYWVVEGGGDNVEHLKRYPGRFMACHIKDRTAGGKMTSVGDGAIPWAEIFRNLDGSGIKYFYVEDDEPPVPELPSIARSHAYLRNLTF